jgi:Flp pilus assembly protein TadD
MHRLLSEGVQLLAGNRPSEAAEKLAQAYELDPENAAAAINLGGAYILDGRHARAIPVLESASRLEPDNAMLWSNLAAAYLGKLPFSSAEGRSRAITAYRRALALDPFAPNVWYNLGLIYLQQDDLEQAAEAFTGALDTDPTDRDAALWLKRLQEGAPGANDAGADPAGTS